MPHTAGSTDGTSRKRAQFAADNLDRYARGEALLAQVTTNLTGIDLATPQSAGCKKPNSSSRWIQPCRRELPWGLAT